VASVDKAPEPTDDAIGDRQTLIAVVAGDPQTLSDPPTTPTVPPPPRSLRSQVPKVVGEDTTIWTYDAANYLAKALANYDGDKLADSWKEFEREMGNTTSKVRRFLSILIGC
jgi:hypothetical protein